jgi:hypothetical protein
MKWPKQRTRGQPGGHGGGLLRRTGDGREAHGSCDHAPEILLGHELVAVTSPPHTRLCPARQARRRGFALDVVGYPG